jgi:hypothetical protein
MHRAVIAGSIVAATLAGGVVAEPVEGDRLAAINEDTVLLAGDDTLGNDHLVAPAGDDTLVVSGDDTLGG